MLKTWMYRKSNMTEYNFVVDVVQFKTPYDEQWNNADKIATVTSLSILWVFILSGRENIEFEVL